jgi:hypothetical protein
MQWYFVLVNGLPDVIWKCMDTRDAGRIGGKARVAKGFAVLTPEERAEKARIGSLARWGAKKEAKKKAAAKKGKATK